MAKGGGNKRTAKVVNKHILNNSTVAIHNTSTGIPSINNNSDSGLWAKIAKMALLNTSTTKKAVNYEENIRIREDKVQNSLLNVRIVTGYVLSVFIIIYLGAFIVSLIMVAISYLGIDSIANNDTDIGIPLEFFQNTVVYILLAALAIAGGFGNKIVDIISSIRRG